MRRLYFASCTLLIALIALAFAYPAAAQTPDPRTDTDAWLSQWITTIQNKQDECIASGAFCQLLSTHTEPVTYTTDVVTDTPGEGGGPVIVDPGDPGTQEPTQESTPSADNLDTAPSDQPNNTWSTLLPDVASSELPASTRIDVYDGPQGKGYVVVLSYCADVCYQKAVNYGPEEWRTYDWIEVESEASQ